MAKPVQFPIRRKLFFLMSGLLLAATFAYLVLSVKTFRQDKVQLIYELNSSAVRTVASQIEATLLPYLDKAALLARGFKDEKWVKAIFDRDPHLVAFSLYQPSEQTGQWNRIAEFTQGISRDKWDEIQKQNAVPFEEALQFNSVAYNSTPPDGPAFLSLAFAVEVQGQGLPLVGVVDLKPDPLFRLLSSRGIAKVVAVDRNGTVLIHPSAEQVLKHSSLSSSPLVQDALKTPLASQLRAFDHQGEKWLGAYASVGIGQIKVIAQVAENEAFSAANFLVQKTVLFGLLVMTASLLVTGLLANSLTGPIQALLDATEKLSRWEFQELIHIRTRDEVAALARSFNSMAASLESQHQQLDHQRKELEIKVRERTAALEQQKEQNAKVQETLLRTSRLASLGELAGVAAHEILNPINNMNVRIELLKKQVQKGWIDDIQLLEEIVSGWRASYEKGGWEVFQADLSKTVEAGNTLLEEDLGNLRDIAVDQEKRVKVSSESLEFLGNELYRITRIVNNMRALSRVGGERRPVEIHSPLGDTVSAFQDQYRSKNVLFLKNFASASGKNLSVIADPDELIQVFSNLIRNSIQAIELAGRREGRVELETSETENRVEIRISDNGAGIDPENLSRVFDPSFTTKTLEKGTGLGLSISKRIIREFGGDVEVESSRLGEGTTFLVWFPLISA